METEGRDVGRVVEPADVAAEREREAALADLGAVMVLGSYYMWWRLPRRRTGGLIALLSGWVVCALFVAGLKLLQ